MNNISFTTHIKNEKIQILFRIIIVSIIIFTLPYFNAKLLHTPIFSSFTIFHLFCLVITLNIFYYILLLKQPRFYYKKRILFISILDVVTSAYVMYLVDSYSAYYPALFLWYTIGYSIRYGAILGISVYVSVLISWLLLMNYSNYWSENIEISIGWLIAFAVIPLYNFKLVQELKSMLSLLHEDLNSSVHQANHDDLTNLPNRVYFNKELIQATQNYKKFALFFIDLDKFKKVNDTYGHLIGDKVLISMATKIMSFEYFAARLGGDEFVCIVEYKDLHSLNHAVQEFTSHLSTECKIVNITISASVGISLFPQDTDNIYELKKKADIAMYSAKKSGKNTYKFFHEL